MRRQVQSGGALLFLLLILQGCSPQEKDGGYVARVGNTYLTSDDLDAMGRSADSSSSTLNYINEWISSELLYQEASRRGVLGEGAVSRRVEDARRRIAVDALLEEELYQDSSGISDAAVGEYYESNKPQFVLREDVALISIALFDDRSVANTFRSSIVRGTSWNDALNDVSGNSLARPHLVRFTNRSYYSRTTLAPEELWKLARAIQPERVSFVVSTDAGYFVLLLHEFRHQGETADLPYVAGEIRDRILIEQRRERYDALISDLRSHIPVEVRLSSLGHETPDTLQSQEGDR